MIDMKEKTRGSRKKDSRKTYFALLLEKSVGRCEAASRPCNALTSADKRLVGRGDGLMKSVTSMCDQHGGLMAVRAGKWCDNLAAWDRARVITQITTLKSAADTSGIQ